MNYGQLKADVQAWLARDDLSGQVMSFIALGEDDINNDLRVRDMIRRARAAGTDSRYLALPDNYLEMRRLEMWPDSDRRYSLIQVTPESLQVLNLRDTSTASYNTAHRYAVHREIEFDAPIGTDAEVEMVYYERYPRLSADTDTNWVLATNYALALYASLLHAEPYLRNDERISVWNSGYQKALGQIRETEERSRVNQAEARVMLSGATP